MIFHSRDRSGFTIVELLIVIVVIGILAVRPHSVYSGNLKIYHGDVITRFVPLSETARKMSLAYMTDRHEFASAAP